MTVSSIIQKLKYAMKDKTEQLRQKKKKKKDKGSKFYCSKISKMQ